MILGAPNADPVADAEADADPFFFPWIQPQPAGRI